MVFHIPLASLLFMLTSHVSAAAVDITAFGAKGDGKTQNRDAINKAIEAAGATGGGTVEFPAGKWVAGSIRLRSNVTLHLDRGAVMASEPRLTPIPPNRRSGFSSPNE